MTENWRLVTSCFEYDELNCVSSVNGAKSNVAPTAPEIVSLRVSEGASALWKSMPSASR